MEQELLLQPPEKAEIGSDSATLSPFLPGTHIQFAWDSTSLGYLKTCPRLYQYVMIEGWGENDQSVHLYFGQEYHKALEEYDIFKFQGEDHEQALRHVVKDLHARIWEWRPDETVKAGKYKNRNSLMMAVIWYIEKYKNDPAKTFILENGKPAVELSFRFELDFGPSNAGAFIDGKTSQPYILCGHLDRVVDFNSSLFVADRKTTTQTLSDYYFAQFEPNNQMTLYTLASQVIINSPVKGVIIDAGQLMIEDARFVRSFTHRTEGQLEEWVQDLSYWLSLAENFAIAEHWPQNDTACDKFGGCRFRGICSKDPDVRERFLKSSFTKLAPEDRWNPLKPR